MTHKKEMKNTIEPYFAKSKGHMALEKCHVIRKFDMKIGSRGCTECKHCVEFSNDEIGCVSWIKCDCLKKAKNE